MFDTSFKKFRQTNIGILVVIVLALTVSTLIFRSGWDKLSLVQNSYEQATQEAERRSREAERIPAMKNQLAALEKEWSEQQEEYAVGVDGGLFFKILNELARLNNINDIDIKPCGSVNNFHQNHLHARVYDLTIRGPFYPSIYNLLKGLENTNVPMEIKPVTFNSEGEEVVASVTVVLYSTNPPADYIYVEGDTGRNNPFYHQGIQTLEDSISEEENKQGEDELPENDAAGEQQDDIAQEQQAKASWKEVARFEDFSGTSKEITTETFNIASDKWRILWVTNLEQENASDFRILLYDNNHALVKKIIDIAGGSNGISVLEGTGEYYLEIQNNKQSYIVVVESMK